MAENIANTDDSVANPPATDPPATDPPAADPPATDPPASDPPATDPPAADPPATDPPASDPPVEEGAPEAYADFTVPEGIEINETMLEKALPMFKEAGLNQADAQKFIDLQTEYAQQQAQAQADSYDATVQEWVDTIKADKEIGGDDFDKNLGIAKQALEKFGTPELSQFLLDSRAGSHPEVIRAFVKIGQLTLEDDPGGSGGANTNAGGDLASRLYPNNPVKTT